MGLLAPVADKFHSSEIICAQSVDKSSCKTVLLLISKGGFAFQRATFNASTIQSAAGQRFFISGDLKTRQQSSREKFIANILYKCTVALGLLGFWHLHLWRHELRCLRSRPSSVSAHQMFSVWHAANQPFTFQPSTKVSGEPGQTEKNQRKKNVLADGWFDILWVQNLFDFILWVPFSQLEWPQNQSACWEEIPDRHSGC